MIGVDVLAGLAAAAAIITAETLKKGVQNMTTNISQQGILFIKKEEGFRKMPYLDIAGHWTIGYGTRIKDPAQYPNGVTIEQATKLLVDHVNKDIAILNLGAYGFSQNVIDAVLSLSYNVGAYAILKSRMWKHLTALNFEHAADEWDWYYYTTPGGIKTISEGLQKRRAREVAMMLGGIYQ